jgi:hypothetical protein
MGADTCACDRDCNGISFAAMNIRNSICTALTAAALGLPLTPSAQERPFKLEVTPFVAYRFGGTLDEKDGAREFDVEDSDARGILLDVPARIGGHWEILYARQNTGVRTQGAVPSVPSIDLDVEYLQFGGSYSFETDSARPFLSFTLGLTRLDPDPLGAGAETYPSASIGGGWHLRADKRVGVRVEGRVFTTFVDSDSRILCQSAGGATCAVRIDSTNLTQWEARAGLVFRF